MPRFDYLLGELSITFMARCNGDFSPEKMRQMQVSLQLHPLLLACAEAFQLP